MDNILAGISHYIDNLNRHFGSNLIIVSKYIKSCKKLDIIKINELYKKHSIDNTNYLLLCQLLKALALRDILVTITSNGLLNIESIIIILKSYKKLKEIAKYFDNTTKKDALSNRIFQILNHYYAAPFKTASYEDINKLANIELATTMLLTDIIRSNTRQSYEHEYDYSQESLVITVANSIIKEQEKYSDSKIIQSFIDKNIFWITKYINNIIAQVLGKFVTGIWLPSKLSINYKTDVRITLKTHITELIFNQDRLDKIDIKTVFCDFIETTISKDPDINQSEIIKNKQNILQFINLQNSLYQNNKQNRSFISDRILKQQALIIDINNRLNWHIKLSNICTASITKKKNDEQANLIELLDHISTVVTHQDNHSITPTIIYEPQSSNQNIFSEFKSLITSLDENMSKQVDEGNVLEITGKSLKTSNLILKHLSIYILKIGKPYLSKFLKLDDQQEPGEQYYFYKITLDEQNKILCNLLDCLNYRGLSLLAGKETFNNYLDKKFSILKYIKDFIPISSNLSKSLYDDIDNNKYIIEQCKLCLSEIDKVLNHQVKPLEKDDINIRYKRLEKTKIELERQISELTDYEMHKKSKLTQKENKSLLNKIISSNIFINIVLCILEPILFITKAFKHIKAIVFDISTLLHGFILSIKGLLKKQKKTTNKPSVKTLKKFKSKEPSAIIDTKLISVTQDSKLSQKEGLKLKSTFDILASEDILKGLRPHLQSRLTSAQDNIEIINKKINILISYLYSHQSNLENSKYKLTIKIIDFLETKIVNIQRVLEKQSDLINQKRNEQFILGEPFLITPLLTEIEHIDSFIEQTKGNLLIITSKELEDSYNQFSKQIIDSHNIDRQVLEICKQLVINIVKQAIKGDKAALTIIASSLAGASVYTAANILDITKILISESISHSKSIVSRGFSWLAGFASIQGKQTTPSAPEQSQRIVTK